MYTYFITPTDVKDLTNISDNLSEKYILTAIREAQQTELTTILGIHFITKLEEAVNKGEVPERYSELLDNYILYFLCYNVISKLIPIASVKIDNAGAVTTGDEKVENLSLDEVFRLQDYYTQKSDYYKMRLQRYLRANKGKYPELDCTSEIHSAYSSPIFLGGKRGKHIIRPCYGCSGHISPEKPDTPDTPEKPYYEVLYVVDGNVHDFDSYQEGERITPAVAPEKDGYTFQYWEGLPEYMPANDITVTAVYQEIPSGGQQYYTLRYRVADWREDGDITFDNMAYIPEPFEWLQVAEREYNPETREGWAKLTHQSLTADTEIKIQKFPGHDCLFMLDLSEFNNAYLTDRLFFDCQTIREFYPPKGLIGIEGGYLFYNCQYLTTINFATAEGYRAYEPFAYPMTGVFCYCVNLTEILADNQSNMYSQDGNLYNISDELMAARYEEVTIKDGCTAILSESLKARGLPVLTIPSSVRTIEVYSISDNPSLSDVYFGGTMQQWADIYKPDVNTIFENTGVSVIHCSDGDCPIDYAGEERTEYKVDICIEWDYLETRWFKVGDKIELPEPPVREGYVFVSWNAMVPGADWFDMPEYMPAFDFEVHASYAEEQPAEKQVYTLTYTIDGEVIGEVDYEFGADVTPFEAPAKEGYTFNGWDNEPTVMPAMDVTVTGSYTEAKPDIPSDYSSQYTTFEALTDGVFSFTKRGTGDDIQYSKDNGTTWTSLASGENVSVATGDKVMWKSTITPSTTVSSYGIGRFATSCDFKVYGNIMSLAYGDDFIDKTDLTGKDYIFYELFNKCAKLTDASELLLPATTLSKYCYRSMFCEASALTKAPELPTTTLAEHCYSWMFYRCASLTTAPELPATTLATQCYSYMFNGCTSLTTAPELPATKLANYCYASIFNSCSKLKHITMLATDISASMCLNMWVGGITSTGTFVKHPDMTSLPSGASGIPEGWTVEDAVV